MSPAEVAAAARDGGEAKARQRTHHSLVKPAAVASASRRGGGLLVASGIWYLAWLRSPEPESMVGGASVPLTRGPAGAGPGAPSNSLSVKWAPEPTVRRGGWAAVELWSRGGAGAGATVQVTSWTPSVAAWALTSRPRHCSVIGPRRRHDHDPPALLRALHES